MTDKPYYFLSEGEWTIIKMLDELGHVWMVAQARGVTESTILSQLSNIRKKVDSAYKFKRRYGKLIERRR